MDQIKPENFDTYLKYYRELSVQLDVVCKKYGYPDDLDLLFPDDLKRFNTTYNFLLQERNHVAISLCNCLLEHDGDIRSPLTPKIRARRPDARASGS